MDGMRKTNMISSDELPSLRSKFMKTTSWVGLDFGERIWTVMVEMIVRMRRRMVVVEAIDVNQTKGVFGSLPPESKGKLLRLSPRDTIRYLNQLKESESSKLPVGQYPGVALMVFRGLPNH
ncbi:hypothetical protein QVD17_38992 [Tagetes erecta]|uniref:Uncharacterized protein n=1 Tax=Tagetes erecta TaxID=13708 RepID=A0AAD8JP79_TARER|nr:hypothetical protein QVD17_38992 [Tagetes erecta]